MNLDYLGGRLSRRIGIYVIMVSVIIAIMSSGLRIYSEYLRDIGKVQASLDLIEKSHLSNISSRVWVLDESGLEMALAGLLSLPDIIYVAAYDNDTLYMTSGKNSSNNVITRTYSLTYRYKNNDLSIGKIVVKASLDEVYRHVLISALIIITGNAVQTLFIVGLILLIFHHLVGRHLSDISAFAKHIDIDTLDEYFKFNRKQTAPNHKDELDELQSAISRMQTNLLTAIHKIKEREQNLSVTLNSIGDAVITTDISGSITRMNPVAEKLTGWSNEEAIGLPLHSVFLIINTITRESVENPLKSVVETGETITLGDQITLLTTNGTEYQISDSAAPIRHGNKILGMVLVFSDLTEKHKLRALATKSQQQLQEKHYELKEILNLLVDGTITIDQDGTILTFNKSAEILFGYKADEIIGHSVTLLVPDSVAREHDNHIKRYIETGETNILGTDIEIEGLHKSQDTFPMRLSITELPITTDGSRHFIGSCMDLRDLKQQEAQLRRSRKMDALGKLTGGIAHDYNNMLTIMLGFLEILHEKLVDQPKLVAYVDKIQHAGNRGAKLTRKLLAFSRHKEVDAGVLNVNKLLLDVQHMLEKTLTARIILSYDLDEELWPIYVDEGDLEDSVINICINAMHAIKGNGLLTIRTSNENLSDAAAQLMNLEAGEYIRLSIIDTGCGMGEDTKDRIFDPFYSTKGDKGTGLGLSQVYGFVERSKGAITVYSEPGAGTQFALYFPSHHGNSSHIDPIKINTLASTEGTETILIVDDEPGLLTVTIEILNQKGYKVLCTGNPNEALLILESQPVDLLLSDIIMPDMDGYQLAAIVSEKYPQVMILLTSGHVTEHIEPIKKNTGREEILYKPYKSADLLNKVRKLLNKSDS